MTYLKYLDSLRASESFRSVWIFAESSYKIFEFAKKRVFYFRKSDGLKLGGQSKNMIGRKRKSTDGNSDKDASKDSVPTNMSSGVLLEEVLEAPPKWKLLRVSK